MTPAQTRMHEREIARILKAQPEEAARLRADRPFTISDSSRPRPEGRPLFFEQDGSGCAVDSPPPPEDVFAAMRAGLATLSEWWRWAHRSKAKTLALELFLGNDRRSIGEACLREAVDRRNVRRALEQLKQMERRRTSGRTYPT